MKYFLPHLQRDPDSHSLIQSLHTLWSSAPASSRPRRRGPMWRSQWQMALPPLPSPGSVLHPEGCKSSPCETRMSPSRARLMLVRASICPLVTLGPRAAFLSLRDLPTSLYYLFVDLNLVKVFGLLETDTWRITEPKTVRKSRQIRALHLPLFA